MEKCKVEGCDKVTVTRGWCSEHMYLWYEGGVTEHDKQILEKLKRLEMND